MLRQAASAMAATALLRQALPAAAAAAAHLSTSAAAAARYNVTGRSLAMDDDGFSPAARKGSTVVLASGGVETAALLAYYTHWDHAQTLLPLFVDYGQKNVAQEEKATQALCRHLGLPFAAVNASMVAHQLNMATAGRRYHDPLPHRNLLLLSLAASFAADNGAANVALCVSKDDLGAYSSSSLPFLHGIEALYASLDPPLALLTPLVGLRKSQIVQMGQQVKAPWHLTYSCQQGKAAQCGQCERCQLRREAFEAAGVEDPALAL